LQRRSADSGDVRSRGGPPSEQSRARGKRPSPLNSSPVDQQWTCTATKGLRSRRPGCSHRNGTQKRTLNSELVGLNIGIAIRWPAAATNSGRVRLPARNRVFKPAHFLLMPVINPKDAHVLLEFKP